MLISAIGLTDALFLTRQHYTRDPFVCPIFGGCELVTSSVYSEVFGIPVSLLGVFYYALVFITALYGYLRNDKRCMRYAAQFSVAGMATSLVLLYLMVYVIQAICFYCMMSTISSTLLFIVGILYLSTLNKYELKPVVKYLSKYKSEEILLGLLRISLGLIFLWAFVEKAGLWFSGGSPAAGYLARGTSGIFADFFASIAYDPFVNHMYMFGLFSVGTALTLGFASRLATIGGVTMMLLIYSGKLPPAHHPILDEHIVYILVLFLLYRTGACKYIGIDRLITR